jgi:hypothetical protein
VRWSEFATALVIAAATATIATGQLRIEQTELQNAFHERQPTLKLPLPDGTLRTFQLSATELLPDSIAFEIRNLAGRSREDTSCAANVVLTPRSVSAQVFSPEGTYYLNSTSELSGEITLAFSKGGEGASSDYQCLTSVGETVLAPAGELRFRSFQNVLRKFRLAPAATAEFTQFHGSKQAAVLEVVTALSRANAIFQRELGISFQLVPGFEQMVFTDPETDPYGSNDPSELLLREAQGAFDDYIGNENYDLGILFTQGFYGLTYFSSVCDPERKGKSCIGLPEPAGDAFHVSLVTHELGHQFGAKHTFNAPEGLCAERRDGWTAFEPGAGSTIMSYATLPCGDNSFQSHNDAYFHSENIKQILDFVNSGLASCAQTFPRENTPPAVSAGPAYTIPAGTPFALTAEATDAEEDTIYYCWEHRDLGPARNLAAQDDGLGPLFRSFPPTTNATRYFPRLEVILAGTVAPEERLPSLERTMNFRVTVRDSHEDGAIDWADTQLQVVNTGAPFTITSHTTPQTISNVTLLEWEVAGTTNPPIGVSHVRIMLSTNGGRSFDIVLEDSTENDGSEEIRINRVQSQDARLKVEAIDNVFFDINDAALTLSGTPGTSPIINLVATRLNEETIRLSWNSEAGAEYVVQSADTLAASEWVQLLETNPPTSSIYVDLLVTNSSSFYRVIAR